MSPENPLTARVTVNRLWKLLYGHGIARSLEESGSQGQLPTHPELLDWLAAEFMNPTVVLPRPDRQGGREGNALPDGRASEARPWDVRHVVRLMVTSSTYRQSAAETPALRERMIARGSMAASRFSWFRSAERYLEAMAAMDGVTYRPAEGARPQAGAPAASDSGLIAIPSIEAINSRYVSATRRHE